jgi:hypothetical protein
MVVITIDSIYLDVVQPQTFPNLGDSSEVPINLAPWIDNFLLRARQEKRLWSIILVDPEEADEDDETRTLLPKDEIKMKQSLRGRAHRNRSWKNEMGWFKHQTVKSSRNDIRYCFLFSISISNVDPDILFHQ